MKREGRDVAGEKGATPASLWRQLWVCTLRLERELREEPYELCWQRPQPAVPPLRIAGAPVAAQGKLGTEPEIQDRTPAGILEPQQNFSRSLSQSVQSTAPPENTAAAGPVTALPTGKTLVAGSWAEEILQCQKCSLGKEETRIRQQAIIGYPATVRGPVVLLLVCDAPNYDADQQESPLDSECLAYLDKWLAAIKMSESYFLTNLVKCRTPGNRSPWPEEIKSCASHLQQQVQIFQPKAILALGSSAARSLSRQRSDLNTLRTRELHYSAGGREFPLFVTYGVREVLQNPGELRSLVWQDLQRLRTRLLVN